MKEKPLFKFALRTDLKDDKTKLFLPTKAEKYATGYDVRAAMYDREELILKPGQYFKIPLGFQAFCPEGWWFSLNPRSSSFFKKHLHCLVGTIDEHFPQEVCLVGQFIPDGTSLNESKISIKFGEAIGQIIPVERVEMDIEEITKDEFDKLNAERNGERVGGFGSSDKKVK
jgi:dUTP pyrophosphatase